MKFEGLDFNYVEFNPQEVMRHITSKWKNIGTLSGVVLDLQGKNHIRVLTSEGSWVLRFDQLLRTKMLTDEEYNERKQYHTEKQFSKHQKEIQQNFNNAPLTPRSEKPYCPIRPGDFIEFKVSGVIVRGTVFEVTFNTSINSWIIQVTPQYSPEINKIEKIRKIDGTVHTILSKIFLVNGHGFHEPNNAKGWVNDKFVADNDDKPPLLYHRRPTMSRK